VVEAALVLLPDKDRHHHEADTYNRTRKGHQGAG
jgi:hypothetical protein